MSPLFILTTHIWLQYSFCASIARNFESSSNDFVSSFTVRSRYWASATWYVFPAWQTPSNSNSETRGRLRASQHVITVRLKPHFNDSWTFRIVELVLFRLDRGYINDNTIARRSLWVVLYLRSVSIRGLEQYTSFLWFTPIAFAAARIRLGHHERQVCLSYGPLNRKRENWRRDKRILW